MNYKSYLRVMEAMLLLVALFLLEHSNKRVKLMLLQTWLLMFPRINLTHLLSFSH